MNIATALNKKYILYTIVMLTSCAVNEPEHICAYLLHSELDEEDFSFIRSSLKELDVEVIDLKIEPALMAEDMPVTEQWTKEMYYRLFLTQVLPKDVERIFYFDVDVIVNKPLGDYYHLPFDGADLIVNEDMPSMNIFSEIQQKMFAPMLEKGYRYFNSGVMLMNIEQLRENYSPADYFNAANVWEHQMKAPDQDLLNYVHWEHVKYVDEQRWDLFARIAHNMEMTYEEVKQNVSIIHFSGTKPWESVLSHFDIEQLWWDYAKNTPIYHELLEDFQKNAILEGAMLEDYLKGLYDKISGLESQLSESIQINQKLLSLIQQ